MYEDHICQHVELHCATRADRLFLQPGLLKSLKNMIEIMR